MSKIDLNLADGEEIERVDPFADGIDDDDELDAFLSAKLREHIGNVDEEEGLAFGPSSAPAKLRESVSIEDGADLLETASRTGGRRGVQAFAGDEDDEGNDDDSSAVATPPAANTPDSNAKPVTSPVAGDFTLASIFGPDRAPELEKQGLTPQAAVKQLADLNTYAVAKPGDYIAWMATQHASGNPEAILTEAAAKLGLKISRVDEDPFEDDEVKELRAFKRQKEGYKDIEGPDQALAPVRVNQDLKSFIAETNPDGTPKRPHFERLNPVIRERLKTLVETEGRRATTQDLATIYDAVTQELGLAAKPAESATPAAQPRGRVADKAPKQDAADRSRRASMSIDGSGQGATRRPALADDASLEDTIRHVWRGSVG